MKQWRYTLALGISYLAVFHLWMALQAPWIFASGAVASLVLAFAGWRAWRSGYFVNGWDAGFHAAVILDIFLESWLVRFHDNFGFYGCAAGFAIVLGAYRALGLAGVSFPKGRQV
jgi:hypothetical protein